ncbi:MAG: MFS transporter [Deltaproteobacteria bacterium]|nr:MFS transporter [Deltaproteobacteria bacterium]
MRPRIPAAVWWLGLVSLLNDAASEMVLPLIPALVTGSLGGSAATLGLIEGAASLVASVLKLWVGRLADRTGRHGAFVVSGYTISNLVRPLMGLVATPLALLLLRLADRVGKGLRTAPRDAVIAHATPPEARAAAFSIHRALDHAGTIAGAGVAAWAVHSLGLGAAEIFLWSAVPGVLVVTAAVLATRGNDGPISAPPGPSAPLSADLRWLLVLIAVSRLGMASELFLLLFAGRFLPLWAIPALWAGLHVVKTLSSFAAAAAGRWVGPAGLVVAGWSTHAAVFAGFAFAALRWDTVFASAAAAATGVATRAYPAEPQALLALLGLFLAWGLYAGLSEGAEKALVAAEARPDARGAAFGAYHLVVGLVALPASVAFGWLWDHASPAAAFAASTLLAGLGTTGLVATRQRR